MGKDNKTMPKTTVPTGKCWCTFGLNFHAYSSTISDRLQRLPALRVKFLKTDCTLSVFLSKTACTDLEETNVTISLARWGAPTM